MRNHFQKETFSSIQPHSPFLTSFGSCLFCCLATSASSLLLCFPSDFFTISLIFFFLLLPVFFLSLPASELCETQQDLSETFFFPTTSSQSSTLRTTGSVDLRRETSHLRIALGTLAGQTYNTIHASCTLDVTHEHHFLQPCLNEDNHPVWKLFHCLVLLCLSHRVLSLQMPVCRTFWRWKKEMQIFKMYTFI